MPVLQHCNIALLLRLLCADGGRAAISRNAAGLANTLGPLAPALLAVVQDPPGGSLPLVLQMVYVLAEGCVPPQQLVAACLQLFRSTGDPRALPPALPGMERSAALRMLGPLLDLQPDALKSALQRLVAPLAGPGGEQLPALLGASEVLAALHMLEGVSEPAMLGKMKQGIAVCLSSPMLFPPEALAATINQLLTRVPLPQLFMRTVIQTLPAAPKLRGFVVGVLRQVRVHGMAGTRAHNMGRQRPTSDCSLVCERVSPFPLRTQLVNKQVWQSETQWKGWLICAQQTAPDSFPALLHLPTTVLARALPALPAALRQQLAAHAQSASGVPQSSLTLLAAEAAAAAVPAPAPP